MCCRAGYLILLMKWLVRVCSWIDSSSYLRKFNSGWAEIAWLLNQFLWNSSLLKMWPFQLDQSWSCVIKLKMNFVNFRSVGAESTIFWTSPASFLFQKDGSCFGDAYCDRQKRCKERKLVLADYKIKCTTIIVELSNSSVCGRWVRGCWWQVDIGGDITSGRLFILGKMSNRPPIRGRCKRHPW